MKKYYSKREIKKWNDEGAVLLFDIFKDKEIKSVKKDIEKVYLYKKGGQPKIHNERKVISFSEDQFLNFDNIPFDCSPALNLICVHPQLISFAKDALGSKQVRLYQSQAWAKYAGETDYEQPFHCDFMNHTITAPSTQSHYNSITFLIYFSDVTEKHGPAHFVSKKNIKNNNKLMKMYLSGLSSQLHEKLSPFEQSTAGPAGTIFAYGIDVFHRATNITVPGGYRYAVTACFKKTGNDSIGYTAWPYHQHKPWNIIFENATPDQLSCFGVPQPGNDYWSKDTIELTQTRFPKWNSKDYLDKLG